MSTKRALITGITGQDGSFLAEVLLALFVGLFRRRPVPEPGGSAPVAAETGF